MLLSHWHVIHTIYNWLKRVFTHIIFHSIRMDGRDGVSIEGAEESEEEIEVCVGSIEY